MKSPITLDGNRINVSLDVSGLKPKHQFMLRELLKSDISEAIAYLDSHNGKYRRVESLWGLKDAIKRSGSDRLADKLPNTILKRQESLYDVFGPSASPGDSTSTWFGVEIECLIPRQEIGSQCGCGEEDCDNHETRTESNSEIKDRIADAFKDARIKNVRVKGDGSLTNNDEVHGIEIVVLTRLEDGFSNLEAACRVLNNIGAKINSTCGLHVHLDCRDGSGKTAANRLVRMLPVLSAMVPRSRSENQYCRLDRSRRGDRYAKINTESLRRHNTVEVRLHSGTTDFKKIKNWILVLHSAARSNVRFSEAISTTNLPYVARKLNWSLDLLNYVSERIIKFRGSLGPSEIQDRAQADAVASEAA